MESVIEISPRHYTLNPKLPLFQLFVNKARLLTLPSSKRIARLYDVNSITENPQLFKGLIVFLADRYRSLGVNGPTHILAIESRGCIIGAPLAMELGIPFVPMRRDHVAATSYVTEGEGTAAPVPPISVRHNSITSASRVVVVDDFIDSGKTMNSAMDCVQMVGATFVEVVAICDMSESGGVDLIHSDAEFKNISVLTMFRLRNSLDVLFYKNKESRL